MLVCATPRSNWPEQIGHPCAFLNTRASINKDTQQAKAGEIGTSDFVTDGIHKQEN